MEYDLFDASLRRVHEAAGPGSQNRRYRFAEHPRIQPGQFVLVNPHGLSLPEQALLGRPDDDLLVFFHSDTPNEVVGRLVNAIRERGDAVEVERRRNARG